MRIPFLFILALLLAACSKVKTPAASRVRAGLKSSHYTFQPSADLLPPEFKTAAQENKYYHQYTDNKHVSVITVRENQSFIHELYYKPYHWARIIYMIGHYRIAGDTMHVSYQPLLEGNADVIYIRPTLSVSWVPPHPPRYFLLNNGSLQDTARQTEIYSLLKNPQFNLANALMVPLAGQGKYSEE